jgi:hypothetical protein
MPHLPVLCCDQALLDAVGLKALRDVALKQGVGGISLAARRLGHLLAQGLDGAVGLLLQLG